MDQRRLVHQLWRTHHLRLPAGHHHHLAACDRHREPQLWQRQPGHLRVGGVPVGRRASRVLSCTAKVFFSLNCMFCIYIPTFRSLDDVLGVLFFSGFTMLVRNGLYLRTYLCSSFAPCSTAPLFMVSRFLDVELHCLWFHGFWIGVSIETCWLTHPFELLSSCHRPSSCECTKHAAIASPPRTDAFG